MRSERKTDCRNAASVDIHSIIITEGLEVRFLPEAEEEAILIHGFRFSSFTPTSTEDPSSDPVLSIHTTADWSNHFHAIKATKLLLVVDFSASWCGPCRFIEPAITVFARKYTDVSFVKIDVDELQSVARDWGVQAMPTFILIKAGNQIDKVIGAKKDELERKILSHRA